MNDFKNDLQQLNVSQFQAGEMTPWDQQAQFAAAQYPAEQYPAGQYPADPTRLCVGIGFCTGFGFGGFCGGFGGFCGGFGGFCGGIGFCRCGGFCGGFHRCGGFCHRCR